MSDPHHDRNDPPHDRNIEHRGITSTAIRRPIGTLALASVVFVLGLFFIERLPIDLLPTIDIPQIRVTVNYPGTAPEVMEEQITRVLERNLAGTENLIRIDSRASEGRTNVNLHFAAGTNLDLALQDASRYLELARTQLPRDIEPPRLYKFDPSQQPVWQAGFSSAVRSEVEVADWVEHQLTPQLVAIHGVSGVETAGGLVREMRVEVDQHRLRYYHLTMADLVAALEAENVDIASGWMTSGDFDVMAKTDGLFTSVEDIANVLIHLPDSDSSVRISDVAQVTDGHQEQRLFVRLDGTPSAQVSVFKQPDANTVEVVEAVQATIARLERSGFIPEDINFQPIGDEAYFIRGAIASVASAAILGGLLAMVLVLLFLGSLRKAFVVGMSIPIAIMATFAMMGIGNLTLNIISLGGLALGVGLLLDNGIVMLENIYRHRDELNKSPDEAAHTGAAEVRGAITAGTLTNLAAVLPFLLITGMAAMVFTDLILTISFAILATLAAALTLIPMLAALLAKVKYQSGFERSRFQRSFNRMIAKLRAGYRTLLAKILHWRWAVLALAVLAFVGALKLGEGLGNEFLPQVDDGSVFVWIGLPSGTPPDETDRLTRVIENTIRELPHVETQFALVGGHLGGGSINERPGTARLRVQLTPASERPNMTAGQWVADAQRKLEALDLPGVRMGVHPPSIRGLRFTTSGDDFAITIVGPELNQLQDYAREITNRLEDIPGLEGVEVGRDSQSPLVRIRVDRERATALGLNVSEVGEAIRMAVNGALPTRFISGSVEYDVRVRLPREETADPERLGDLLLFRQHGEAVLLRDVARFEMSTGPAHIERENQGRIQRVVGNINTQVSDVGTIMEQVEERLQGMEMSDRYSLIFGGQWEAIQETNRELMSVIGLALFLVLVVLAVQYERLTNPLVILAAAPLSLIGVVLMLWATGTPLSAPVMIGVVLLIGIVVNNAILLVEYIELGRRNHNLSIEDAVLEAGSIRLRPILMTTLTTVVGMTPLAIGLGEGAEIMRPLAIAVIGGLMGAMLLTLAVIPCLYLVSSRGAEWLKAKLVG
ncbi:efflux RND transporter permease subunit [Marinimicrobium sp. ABcell2]|uniref:efflux RND transporter permease subunit n=1 Tax=Marinimicrobium sp. ABcell2 TaxID=3069751 RepID=UPI0027B21D4E|nr:efflux RND transporter permease subunit [Marinimicrobium sp. ABcell2]MDQ2076107.1 efflux RND transporter permease subunit [Marinimicrobium sp. ABcell2]